MRPDLAALTAEALVELTNAGTVRRARKELNAGARFVFTADGGELTASDGDVRCVLGTGACDTWTCTCVMGAGCRHVVRAVLDWQRQNPAAGDVPAGDVPAADVPACDVPATGDASDDPPVSLPAGLVAVATVSPAGSRVRLLHPEHVAIRFLVGTDRRYARCECGRPGCVHVGQACAVLGRCPGPDGGPGGGLVVTASVPVAVPALWRQALRRWVDQLVDLGLPAAAELMTGAVRLAASADQAGLAHPAAVLREIAEQLGQRIDHSSMLSPVRLLQLLGELEARLRALDRAELPTALVAGTRPVEVASGKVRLAGLGADYRQVGGWHEVRAYVADTGTGAVRTVTLTRIDTTDVQHVPADLGLTRQSGARMIDWATGRGRLPSARRIGDELIVPRGRWTMAANATLDVDPAFLAPIVLPAEEIPAALGPRRPADDVGVVEVHSVDRLENTAGQVTARLVDRAGTEAVLRLRPDPRAAESAGLLAEVLANGVSAVAGRWRRSADGSMVVTPTAVWSAAGVLLPQLGVQVAPARAADEETPPRRPALPLPVPVPVPGDVHGEPWTDWWASLADALARLLVTGSRRGATAAAPVLRECAAHAGSLGLGRCSELAGRIADDLSARTVLDAAVLLALVD